jgi:molybdopterin-containing oxidoreductase family iron-sulfur binding subunit
MNDDSRPSFAALRARLAAADAPALWRSLDALVDAPEFEAFLHQEFPQQALPLGPSVDRRHFLKLMGASLGLAGMTACTRQPEERVVPYVKPPEELVLGEALFYATALTSGGFATGVLVESHEGRPTKIEGNPMHPASLGGVDATTQAAILGLYDPDRSQTVSSAGAIRPWGAFADAMRVALAAQRPRRGAGLRILTETVTSPTLAAQIDALLREYPDARWHQWEPFGRDGARLGAQRAFGDTVETRYDLSRADVVVVLDADLFGSGPSRLRYARQVTARRTPGADGAMNRLYVVEPIPTTVGAIADHRLPLPAGRVETLARTLASAVGLRVATDPATAAIAPHARWVEAVARDLQQHRGTSAVVVGDQQAPSLHALAHALNAHLGNVGRTVLYSDAVEARPADQAGSLESLVADVDAGTVELLVIAGGNPVFTAPADVRFGERLRRVPTAVHLGLYEDETAELCLWHVPEAHPLEAWSDARAHDGTVSVVQPLIAPLYGGRTVHELLAVLLGEPDGSGYDVLRDHWRPHLGADFEATWRRTLHDGVMPGTAAPTRPAVLRTDWDAGPGVAAPADRMEVLFRPDPYVGDGRFANNAWLLELPRPVTKLVWDNAAVLAPATAEQLGVANGDVLELGRGGARVRISAWIVPGHAPGALTLPAGFGRRRGGANATSTGVDVYALRTTAAPYVAGDVEVRRTGERAQLVSTQDHQSMEGRAVVRSGTLAKYRAHPEFAREMVETPARDVTLYPPEHRYPGYAWGMAIDLTRCIGCNACTLACQAENNIAVVGKDQVARGREMHWIRVDRYYGGNVDAPEILHQPVPCMHCENAPCEVVCPVNATVHDGEGLNVMVYNRCVGTRYCSNNCPYKVRRFNFYLYSDWATEPLKLGRNPDVTVRSRGVMEKCTYCVQRINRARIEAEKAGRRIRDGELVTACQQACPADVIVFGDLNDPSSRVAKLRADARTYELLGELNTRPRTTYLARIRNPNPDLEPEEGRG